MIKRFLQLLERWLEAFSIDDVDEDDEFVEGDEREDMAEERLVGETEDFFWWSLWWSCDDILPLSLPGRSWLDETFALLISSARCMKIS